MNKKILQEKRFFKIIILAVVLLIPVIYSFFYLKSYWNPYGNLGDVKVGLVNLDKGDKGSELIKSLQEAENTLGFTETSSDEAIKGLSNDDYYAVITIPENFTKSLESGADENKQKAIITYTPNKRKNYLAYQIINSGLKSAEIELQSKVAKETTNTLANKIKEIPENLDKINSGVGQIKDGSESLNSGLNELSAGVSTLNIKYTEFDAGIKSATDGSKALTTGLTQSAEGTQELQKGATSLDNGVNEINQALNNADISKLTQLTDGISALNTGVNSLQIGINSYIAGQNQLDKNQDQILQGIVDYYNGLIEKGVTPDSTLTQLAGGANQVLNAPTRKQLTAAEKQLVEGASQVTEGAKQLNNNTAEIKELSSKITILKNSLAQVEQGTGKLKDGINSLNTGTNKIKNGANSLSNGLGELSRNSNLIKTALQQLDTGSKSALDGSVQLTEGITTLKNSIEDGKNTANEQIKKLDGLSDFVEDPVEFKEESFGEVDSYGVAFTPLFLSIGLWVGALMLYVILYYDQKHRFGRLDHEAPNKVLQNLIYIAIGAIEGILTGIILKALLGFNVTSTGVFLLECMLTGMTFTTIMQFLIRNFGDIGKFLCLIILVLQLAASGGTFPVETIDKGFQAFTSWLPMTYTVRIFKDCLIQTDSSLIGKNTIILLFFFAILFVINMIIEVVKIYRVKQSKQN